jgi:hypothetical protein
MNLATSLTTEGSSLVKFGNTYPNAKIIAFRVKLLILDQMFLVGFWSINQKR